MLFSRLIDRRIEAYQSDLMKKYCDEVESMYRKMRGWRHDYHNHIQAMQASMALGRYEEVNEYPKIPYQLYICQPMFSPKSSIISL